MTVREVWIGTYGPLLYDDAEPYQEEPGVNQKAIRGVNLNDLEDLEITSPVQDHSLFYDAANSVFKNVPGVPASGGTFTGAVAFQQYLDFSAIVDPAVTRGRLWYNADLDVFAYYDDTNARVLIGNALTFKARNTQGASISIGQAVKITGSTGDNPEVVLAQADSPLNFVTVGLVLSPTINNNANGRVITNGRLSGVDTSAWVKGTELYLSATTPGALTSTKPSCPYYIIRIGIVVRQSDTDGAIYVDVDAVAPEPFSSHTFADFVLQGTLDENTMGFCLDENKFSLMVVEKDGN